MSILIIPVILVIVVVVFVVVFREVPDRWVWVSIVFAAVGIAIGAPGALQRMFGRPKLMREYDRYVKESERGLIILLKNPQLGEKSFLRKLGVRRDTIASLSAGFELLGKGKVEIPIMHSRIYADDDPTEAGSWRIALPATLHHCASIMIARWDNEKEKAIVPGDTVRSDVELSDGKYRMNIFCLVDGQAEIEFREFIVGRKADDLVWVKRKGNQ